MIWDIWDRKRSETRDEKYQRPVIEMLKSMLQKIYAEKN